MTISFIICTYNRDTYIYQCLRHLTENNSTTYQTQDNWEIILVDNNSTDHTAQECQRFVDDFHPKHYRYILEPQQGLSFARNRGIQEAHGDWLVFLDDDAMVNKDYIRNLQHHLHSYPNAGAFGGAIKPFFEGETPAWLSHWSLSFVSGLDMGKEVKLFASGKFPIGANMGIARNVIEQVGDFNTTLGRTKDLLLGGEEKDLFLRIQNKGYPIYYFPHIDVIHCIPERRTTEDFIARLGYGVGVSERLRTQHSLLSYIQRLFSETIKWGGTLVLWFYFTLLHQSKKGHILLLFRKNVTLGLCKGKQK